MTTFIDFLEVWKDFKLESLSDRHLLAFRNILLHGLTQVEQEMELRAKITTNSLTNSTPK